MLFVIHTGFPLDLEAGYEYKKIFRDVGLDYIADNHTLRVEVTYSITPNAGISYRF